MPLFVCSNCGTVDNTALGAYWTRRDEPLCAKCARGAWHGAFERVQLDDSEYERVGEDSFRVEPTDSKSNGKNHENSSD